MYVRYVLVFDFTGVCFSLLAGRNFSDTYHMYPTGGCGGDHRYQ